MDDPKPQSPKEMGGVSKVSAPAAATDGARSLHHGHYMLVRKIAEGGTAEVHLGYDAWSSEWRAIKTLLPDYSKRPALRHRFEREAETMKALSHPNIIRVFDAGSEGETAWLVMEYAEGGSIIDWVERNGPMPPRLAVTVVLELCAGIQYAHQEGVIHRDIKPQNVLVDRHGQCKVTDFGIAQVVQETRMTMTGTVMGTIGYMAPEQHESAKHADERADVYSIAASLYTLLKGEAATHLFMNDDRDFDGLPDPLTEVIRKGAQYRKEARYQTVAELIRALKAAQPLLPEDPPDTPPLVPDPELLLDSVTPPSLADDAPPPAEVARREMRPAMQRAVPAVRPAEPITLGSGSSDEPTAKSGTALVPRKIRRSDESGWRRADLLSPYRDRKKEELQAKLRVGLVAAATTAGFLFLCLLATGLYGIAWVERLGRFENEARGALEAQVEREVLVLDTLKRLDRPNFDQMRELWATVGSETADADTREGAVGRLQALLEQEYQELAARNRPDEESVVKQIGEALRHIEVKRAQWEDFRERTDAFRETIPGRLATLIGY
jgi:serine/threonine protein kinase